MCVSICFHYMFGGRFTDMTRFQLMVHPCLNRFQWYGLDIEINSNALFLVLPNHSAVRERFWISMGPLRFLPDCLGHFDIDTLRHFCQTLPKAQRTRGLSSYHRISIMHQLQNLNQTSASQLNLKLKS